MKMYRWIVVFLGLVLGGSALADWQVQVQEKNGSWRDSYKRATQDAARAMTEASTANFEKELTFNLAYYEQLRSAAMKQCGLGQK